jgi:hypothetical protein
MPIKAGRMRMRMKMAVMPLLLLLQRPFEISILRLPWENVTVQVQAAHLLF